MMVVTRRVGNIASLPASPDSPPHKLRRVDLEFKIGRAIDIAPFQHGPPYCVADRNRDANRMIGSASNEDIMLPGT